MYLVHVLDQMGICPLLWDEQATMPDKTTLFSNSFEHEDVHRSDDTLYLHNNDD